MQTQTRRLLGAVAALMVFWIVCRTVKYFLVTNPDVGRYLWYLYYFPMLFIPFLSVFVAFSLGKPENYRLPLWSRVFYAPVTVLLAFVLTNDLHQTVFVFPPDEVIMSDSVHTYGVVYFIVVGCMAVCAFIAFAVMILKWPRFTRT